jgi:hypothetical protein
MGGGVEAGGAVARRAPGPGVARRRVLRQRAHGRRLPARGGARPPAEGGEAAAPAHIGARAGKRAARRRADGGSSGDRILQKLEDANAFVVSLDPARTWFRYHHASIGSSSSPTPATRSWSSRRSRSLATMLAIRAYLLVDYRVNAEATPTQFPRLMGHDLARLARTSSRFACPPLRPM